MLLLKVAAQAGKHITLQGQEKDVTTAGLARMNMILHDFPTANILSGNTLAATKLKDDEQLRAYDYVVANPPFSDKTWTTGINPSKDSFKRFFNTSTGDVREYGDHGNFRNHHRVHESVRIAGVKRMEPGTSGARGP